ncbi:MAG: FAD-binding protein [Gammaproteobacteria bacterium]|nr:FAD-binding protein [Gammaproteobacteria bacterium]
MLERSLIKALGPLVGGHNLLTDQADCWPYGYDNSRRHALPDAVVFGTDHGQILELVRFCNHHRIALTPRGRGTGTTGATVPVQAGIVLTLERMDRIKALDPANRIMIVEPGVTNQAAQDIAGEQGFFWPPDPTSAAYCSIGGNLAYNSAGPRAIKYGTPRENTLALRAITGAGEEIKTGAQTSKGVVGLDLTRLLVGSEGILAIITEATLKLTPLPESKRTLQAIYADVESAACAVSSIMAQPMAPYALEFMDGQAMEMIRGYTQTDLPADAGALLMIEVDGAQACIEAAAKTVAKAARVSGCLRIVTADSEREVNELWATRKALSPALRNVAPNKINEDVVVPVSRMAELIGGLQELSRSYDIPIVNFGHAGNGNIHVNLLVDTEHEVQIKAAEKCLDEVFSLVLKLQGTLSGEHGIGLVKRDFVDREIDPQTLDLMRGIKRQFDPNGILNPDKVFPLV